MTHDDRPIVSRLLHDTGEQVGHTVKSVVRMVGRGPMLALSGLVMLAVFTALVVRGVAQSGAAGIVSGVIAGLVAALLCGALLAWTLIWAFASPATSTNDAATAPDLDRALASTLRELDAVRQELIARGKARSVVRVPLAVAAAVLGWGLLHLSSEPPGVVLLTIFVCAGAVLGEGWAVQPLDRQYRRLYQERVLPQLAARFGNLTFRRPGTDRVQALRTHGIFKDFERSVSEHEIVGSYRGHPLSIVEVRLERGTGEDETRTLFDGLLIELRLPRPLSGSIAIVANDGVLAAVTDWMRGRTGQPIRVDNEAFTAHYRVYATDPHAARGLLTPAFVQQFVVLGGQSRFSLPGALAEGDRLCVALPRRNSATLFSAPSYWSHAGGQALVALDNDIRLVLSMADAVIGLGSVPS